MHSYESAIKYGSQKHMVVLLDWFKKY
jgi:hypothetical protein